MATKKDNQPDNKTVDPLMRPVQEYLEQRAAEDPQFAEKYANPKKSLKECCRYIYGEARKRAAGSQCVYIDPQEVYGWAVHYYDEEKIKISKSGYTGRATVAAAPAPKPVELTDEQKAEAQQRALEKYEAQQLAKIAERERLASCPAFKGWVARDEDGTLTLFRECDKPFRVTGRWRVNNLDWLILEDDGQFIDLTWEDEPREVEIIIKEVGK